MEGDTGGNRTTAPRRTTRVVGVTAVCVLAGLLFGTSASLARDVVGEGGAVDLPGLITQRDATVQRLDARVEELSEEVEVLRQERGTGATEALTRRGDALAPGLGLAEVSGPALSVTLDDAGYDLASLPEGIHVDDVVVHQQDLQGVINALWAGGAEAVMVMDQRIVAGSAVRCVGNTLYVQGRVYSPPFTVTAIGDREALRAALDADPVVSTYRGWADAVGLGYEVQELGETTLPAYTGQAPLQYASLLQRNDPSTER